MEIWPCPRGYSVLCLDEERTVPGVAFLDSRFRGNDIRRRGQSGV